jgi:hypothetical protein
MCDETPSALLAPIVNRAIDRHELRVALVHSPSSENQARELMEGLVAKNVNVVIVNVSLLLLCFGSHASCQVTALQVRWREFQDGWPDTFIENVDELRGRHVVFLMNIVHSSALFAQLSLALVLSRSGACPRPGDCVMLSCVI